MNLEWLIGETDPYYLVGIVVFVSLLFLPIGKQRAQIIFTNLMVVCLFVFFVNENISGWGGENKGTFRIKGLSDNSLETLVKNSPNKKILNDASIYWCLKSYIENSHVYIEENTPVSTMYLYSLSKVKLLEKGYSLSNNEMYERIGICSAYSIFLHNNSKKLVLMKVSENVPLGS